MTAVTATLWTAKAVEYRVLEAAETLMLCPNHYGGGGSAWPAFPQDPQDSYAYNEARYRRRPSPGALSRMTQTWGWINAHPAESERKLLYAWAWQKTKKGRFLNDFASREGINSRTLRRAITAICQAIADRLTQAGLACFEHVVDEVSEITTEIAPIKVPSQKHASHFMEPGAKPRYPTPAEIKALKKRLEKANRKRAHRNVKPPESIATPMPAKKPSRKTR
ncbi:MAG: hypothetical protein E5Y01_16275 [Mesorhizobium sp.]|uniref:DUF6362 family protein n=1 Tax=Mesorhizobium sp. TaxID=1871066 RepID=UPI00120E13AD|nr:DUF6362 family protein [Mesorhizobium sp.]TJV51143.1 MAG: hypothetical protein E5Y01_16275 [Mesorhizobium sp.]